MIARARVLFLMGRPLVMVLLGIYAALGVAQGGRSDDELLLLEILVVVAGFLLFSVACNDIADEAIDRVNLPGDRQRPLVTGAAKRRELVLVGVVSAVMAVATAALLHPAALLVLIAGMVVSAAYSLRPVRLADRGAVASLVLPACYVGVPYLVGLLAASGGIATADITLLAGLYIGFIGRILLKDFRDLRGDVLFGKRTFLVRHGRAWTCLFSAICWIAGTITVVATLGEHPAVLLIAYGVALLAVLGLLRGLATYAGQRRDEAIISAIAIIGRGMAVVLLAHLSMTASEWPPPAYALVVAALAVVTAGQAWVMVTDGPSMRLTVPPTFGPSKHERHEVRG